MLLRIIEIIFVLPIKITPLFLFSLSFIMTDICTFMRFCLSSFVFGSIHWVVDVL